ncbi:MAG: hypothetical protein AAGI17_06375 [Planctomycetota bacterium]
MTPPAATPDRPTAVIWSSVARVEMLPKLIEACGVTPFAAGGIDDDDHRLSESLGCDPIEDLRAAIGSIEADAFLILDPIGYGDREDPADAEAVLRAAERGAHVISAAPLPGSLAEIPGARWLHAERGVRAIDRVRLAPLPRRSRVWPEVAELIPEIGPIDAARIHTATRPGGTNLGTCLLAAIDLLCGVLGEPERIDAALVGHGLRHGRRRSLRSIEGDLHALARFGDGRAATITATDRTAHWTWSAELRGPQGTIAVTPEGFIFDHATAGRDQRLLEPHAVTLEEPWGSFARYVRERVATGASADAPHDLETMLCVADAALLSAATGEPASPATARRAIDPARGGLW